MRSSVDERWLATAVGGACSCGYAPAALSLCCSRLRTCNAAFPQSVTWRQTSCRHGVRGSVSLPLSRYHVSAAWRHVWRDSPCYCPSCACLPASPPFLPERREEASQALLRLDLPMVPRLLLEDCMGSGIAEKATGTSTAGGMPMFYCGRGRGSGRCEGGQKKDLPEEGVKVWRLPPVKERKRRRREEKEEKRRENESREEERRGSWPAMQKG